MALWRSTECILKKFCCRVVVAHGCAKSLSHSLNKLAKARKTRKSPGTLGLKKFGLGKLWVKKVFRVKKRVWVKKVYFGQIVFRSKKFFGSKN